MNEPQSAFGHLAPEFQEKARASDEERIEWIRSDRWIPYPAAERASDHLHDLLHWPSRGRMPCLLLYGPPNIGKTKIIEKFLKDNPIIYDETTRRTTSPVVALQMPSEPDIGMFYQELLRAMDAPITHYSPANVLRNLGRQTLEDMRTRMLVIDEVEAMLAGTSRQQHLFLNELRFLTNDLRLCIVAVGPAEARVAITTDRHLADRFEEIELRPWKANGILADLLSSFEAQLPLRLPSRLATPAVGRRIVSMTEGNTGRILRLIETAAVHAIKTGKEHIDEASFTTTDLMLPLASISRRPPPTR